MIIYLASPYTSPNKALVEERYNLVCEVASRLMSRGYHIFSPIAHTHAIARCGNLPTDYAFWEEYDRKFLSVCGELWVLTLPGWKESKGVRAEIRIAGDLRTPIRLIGLYDVHPSEPMLL